MISKEQALDYAIQANLENDMTMTGHSFSNVDKLIEAAKKIENYINGETENENV